jgi:UDP-glucose 4-epimerase
VKVFVTGGAGYIGSVCVEELLNLGHEVTVFDNLSEGHREAIDLRAHFIGGNICEPEEILSAFRSVKPEAVMHFAAKALVGESMTDPYKYFHNNVYGGLNLLRAAVETDTKKFVFSSSCATYGIPERVPIDEEADQRPVSPYGESKLMFENILHWFDQIHGIKYVALRYFNAAGASERFGEHHRIETHLIPRVLGVALGHSPHAEVFGTDYPTPDGSCVRDYIHVCDLAQAHILALSAPNSGFFNLGTGGGVSVYEVLEACRQVTGHSIPILKKPRRPGDPPRLIAASEKARKVLGWKPERQDIVDIVESAWTWHKKHPTGYEGAEF